MPRKRRGVAATRTHQRRELPSKEQLERRQLLSNFRRLGTQLAHDVRLGKFPGWSNIDGRGQCGRCKIGKPSPSWQQGCRLFRKSTWIPNSAAVPHLGIVTSSPLLCAACALTQIEKDKHDEQKRRPQSG